MHSDTPIDVSVRLIRGTTINELVCNGLYEIVNNGTRTGSRNGNVYCLYNGEFALANPRSRHLNLKGRQSNIFALIAETFWVLAGEERIDPYLSFFLPRAKDFSDNGETWRGAYGPRLYHHGQLEDALLQFEEEGFETRKSLITLYLPELDTKASLRGRYELEKTKDRPCNNTLSFFATPDRRLHMNVTQRSGDIIWGMGSINIFEWTVLHEFVVGEVARRTGEPITLGSYNHHVTNVHLYDFNGKQGFAALANWTEQDFTSENTEPLHFPTGVEPMRHFFRALVMLYTDAIVNEEQDFERVVKQIEGVFLHYYDDEAHDGLMLTYARLVAAYVCTKNGAKDVLVDVRMHANEVIACIEASRFRTFSLA